MYVCIGDGCVFCTGLWEIIVLILLISVEYIIWLGLNVYVNLIFQKGTNCESILVHVPPAKELRFFKNIKVIIFIHYTYLYLVGVNLSVTGNFFWQVLISFFL